jgi:hypothetical protein
MCSGYSVVHSVEWGSPTTVSRVSRVFVGRCQVYRSPTAAHAVLIEERRNGPPVMHGSRGSWNLASRRRCDELIRVPVTVLANSPSWLGWNPRPFSPPDLVASSDHRHDIHLLTTSLATHSPRSFSRMIVPPSDRPTIRAAALVRAASRNSSSAMTGYVSTNTRG